MKGLVFVLVILGSLSSFARDKTCVFTVASADNEVVYSKVLSSRVTGIANEKLENGYRVNLSAVNTKRMMKLAYSDVNYWGDSERHELSIKGAGAKKKVITDVNGDLAKLRLICAYDKE